MFSSGIGGGGFLIVRNPEPCRSLHPSSAEDAALNASSHHALPRLTHCASHTVIDFRETAPALANTTLYSGRPDAARFGGLSVGVPGEVAGLEEAHKRWGVLPWERLVEPSVKLAREARVSRELARRLSVSRAERERLLSRSADTVADLWTLVHVRQSRLDWLLQP